MLITSKANPKIKQMRRLFNRRHRERTGLFFAEGLQLVEEAAEMGAEFSMLVVAPELLDEERTGRAVSIRERTEAPSLEVSAEVLNSVSPQDGHQGIAAVVGQRWKRLEEVELTADSCWVAVERIRHPGSIGTILRVCDAVGGEGVVLIGECSDPYDPTAVRASLGAIFSQAVVKASVEEFVRWREGPAGAGFVVGTSPSAATEYWEVSYASSTVVLMGSDRAGLSADLQRTCDAVVSIPMAGRCDSHHVAVAAGIVLYEVFKQRRAGKKGQQAGGRPSAVDDRGRRG